MADVKWIKMDIDIFNNRKIRQIEILPDGDSIIVIWVKLLCLAGNINDNGAIYLTEEIPYTEQMLATQFSRPLATIQLALTTFEQFGMVEVVDNILHISNWEKYQNIDRLNELREYNRLAQQKSRAKRKLLAEVNDMSMTSQSSQGTDIDKIRKEEDKEKNKSRKEKRVWYPEDEALNDAFERYIEHRKKMKKSMSEYACERAMSKLEDLSQGDNDVAIAIIEQSIKECWQGLFALKEQPKKKSESVVDDIAAALKELTGEDL